MIKIYFILCLLGTLFPSSALLPWLLEHGFDIALFYQEATSNQIGLFAWMDVIVSAATLIIYILSTGPRNTVAYWWVAIIATLTVGVSLGLPLYLLLQESSLRTKRECS